jgi:diaminopimelate epimerase
MDKIPFFKMSGSGNDFIIIDNRRSVVDEDRLKNLIVSVCQRKMSVGADGFILIEDSNTVDFKWRFYNSDGSRPEMCGNGARCAARFAFLNNIAAKTHAFETDAGVVAAEIIGDRAKIKMPDPSPIKADFTIELTDAPGTLSSVNTGVPHVILETAKLDDVDVFNRGREIRYHKTFAPDGTNVNFATVLEENRIAIRTYERGVEDETLACGTGSIAAALVTAAKNGWQSPVNVHTRSGIKLTIHFARRDNGFRDVYLEGDARVIYRGELWEEAYI